MKSVRERIDVLMVARGLAGSREQAKRLILAGAVEITGIPLPKPGQTIESTTEIRLKKTERYVSRGGLKLEEALSAFSINLTGRTCADIGASTGGFTDCMLQHGAARVYSVDVGVSQMHERLKKDLRVVLVEHTNARDLEAAAFSQPPDFVAVDVSFISITRITAALRNAVSSKAEGVFLIKPQFEAGREAVSRGKGVIRDTAVHREVLIRVLEALCQQKWQPKGLITSPIKGGSGNVEFLCHAAIAEESSIPAVDQHIDIDDVIRTAGATP